MVPLDDKLCELPEVIAGRLVRGDAHDEVHRSPGGGVSLGLIYTDSDRAFIIVSPNG